MRSITVDPAKLEAAASKIDTHYADYERTYKQLFSEVEGMAAAWQGKDNEAYTTQIKGFEDDFQKMVALMKEYAEFLRKSAAAYRSAQEEVASQARRLTN